MPFVVSKMIPSVFRVKSSGEIYNLATRFSYRILANRTYSVCCNSSVLEGRESFSSNSLSRHKYLHINESPFKLQRRNISDYVDGRSFYKWVSECTPVSYTQSFVVFVHDLTGLPWWATIIGTTVFLRCAVTLPLAIYQTSIFAKVENIALVDMPELTKDTKTEVAKLAMQNKWNQSQAQKMYKKMLKGKWNALVIQQNCHPLKGTITLWVQLPMWVFFTTALRNIANMLPNKDIAAEIMYIQMSVGGFGWIPNLTVPDETWFLPTILGISNLAIIELQTLRRVRQAPLLQKYITNTFRCLTLFMIPISAMVPSAVCLYWTTSSVIGLGQNLFLMSNRVRHRFGIPDTPTTVDNPYLQLLTDIKERGRNITKLMSK